MADITRFNKLEVRGKIYRHKYVKVCMKYGVGSEYKVYVGLPRVGGGPFPYIYGVS